MLLDEIINIKIHSTNKNYYKEILKKELLNGEIIKLSQLKVSPSSHMKLKCKCDLCDKEFYRMRKDIKESTLCSKKCRNEFLKKVSPTLNVEKIKVNCKICEKEIIIIPSKLKIQENFLCSRECYKKHRSLEYKENKIYNYQNTKIKCCNNNCEEYIKTSDYYMNKNNNQFCSQECYWKHRKDNYLEFYYPKNLIEGRKETKPEKLVREWLIENNINFEKEKQIIGYFADFYLTDYDSILEVYGDYWHCNPKYYGENKKQLTESQLFRIHRDEKRMNLLNKKVTSFNVIWEDEVYNDIDNVMGDIINKLINENP